MRPMDDGPVRLSDGRYRTETAIQLRRHRYAARQRALHRLAAKHRAEYQRLYLEQLEQETA